MQTLAVEEIQRNAELTPNPKKDELKNLREQFSKPIVEITKIDEE